MQKEKRQNIGIVTFPISEAGVVPLRNLVDIAYPLTDNLYLLTGNAGYSFFKQEQRIRVNGIQYNLGSNILTKIVRYAFAQLQISYKLAQASKKIDLFIFFTGGPILLLPMLTSKLLRKRVILAVSGSDTQSLQARNSVLSLPVRFMVRINLELSNNIVLYSQALIRQYNLQKYRHKISIAHRHFLDLDKFKLLNQLSERENLVGYIGRLSEEKGILNFVKAIPGILKQQDEAKFLIGGEGRLRDKIDKYLDQENLNSKVKLLGWIPHDELPKYLDELKLLVLPSYTEGLPNIMLEAMACGTPVLATPVGAIPDILKDEETGFIMKDNSPECIARNVIRALNHPDLEQITVNAHQLVGKEYTYEAAKEAYRNILTSLRPR